MLTLSLVYSIDNFFGQIHDGHLQALTSSIGTVASNLAEWTITQIYIKVAFEIATLLDRFVYFDNEEKFAKIDRMRVWLHRANVGVAIFALAIGIM